MRVLTVRLGPLAVVAAVLVMMTTLGLVGKAGEVVRTSASQEKRPIYSVETEEKKVSLGINCAWDNADIPQLIDILEQHNVKATFFVVGDWCDNYPESVKALFDAGHEIGTHSDTHADMAKLDEAGILRELRTSADKVEAITGVRPTLFRPPSGSYNTAVIALAEQEGFYPIQWDCDLMHIETINQKRPITRALLLC